MANGTTNAGLMDRNVPSELNVDDLNAEIELELPGSQNDVMAMVQAEDVGRIEITPEEDGGVVIDFDPSDQRGENGEFDANLAEEMPEKLEEMKAQYKAWAEEIQVQPWSEVLRIQREKREAQRNN